MLGVAGRSTPAFSGAGSLVAVAVAVVVVVVAGFSATSFGLAVLSGLLPPEAARAWLCGVAVAPWVGLARIGSGWLGGAKSGAGLASLGAAAGGADSIEWGASAIT